MSIFGCRDAGAGAGAGVGLVGEGGRAFCLVCIDETEPVLLCEAGKGFGAANFVRSLLTLVELWLGFF